MCMSASLLVGAARKPRIKRISLKGPLEEVPVPLDQRSDAAPTCPLCILLRRLNRHTRRPPDALRLPLRKKSGTTCGHGPTGTGCTWRPDWSSCHGASRPNIPRDADALARAHAGWSAAERHRRQGTQSRSRPSLPRPARQYQPDGAGRGLSRSCSIPRPGRRFFGLSGKARGAVEGDEAGAYQRFVGFVESAHPVRATPRLHRCRVLQGSLLSRDTGAPRDHPVRGASGNQES